MNKIFNSRFLLAGIVILAIAFVISKTSFAQEVSSTLGLEMQISRLTETLNNVFLSQNQSQTKGVTLTEASGPKALTVSATASEPSLDCLTGHSTWPSSATLKTDSPWNMNFVRLNVGSNFSIREHFTDINGDGLLDYLFLDTGATWLQTCVYLNNGTGFEKAFRCIATQTSGIWTYKGDCAG